MIKRFLFFFQASMVTLCGHAQLWEPLGNGFTDINSGGPQVFYIDPLTNELFIGGGFADTSNGDTLVKVCRWDGNQFLSFGCGIDWECGTELNIPFGYAESFIRFNNEIISSGGFDSSCGNSTSRIIKFNGECWEDFGNCDYMVKELKIYQDTLYACGIDTCAGLDCNGLAKWNGETWLPVHDMPLFESTSGLSANNIATFEWFQGNLYVGGNWNYQHPELNYDDFVMWNGTEWMPVGNGLTGTFSWVRKLLVFQDKLIVIGGFSGAPNPGNFIAAWDGENWDDMDGGFVNPTAPSAFYPIQDAWATDEYLYVVGGFQYAGGLSTENIARWDGEEWCGYGYGDFYDGFYWDNIINSVCIYNDELIVGGNFENAGNDTDLNLIARYTGPGTCVYTGIEEQADKTVLNVYPNPAKKELNITLPIGANAKDVIAIYDMHGRLMQEQIAGKYGGNLNVDVSGLSQGMYVLRYEGRDVVLVEQFVRE